MAIDRTVMSEEFSMQPHMSGAACIGVRMSCSNCASAALRSSLFWLIKAIISISNCASAILAVVNLPSVPARRRQERRSALSPEARRRRLPPHVLLRIHEHLSKWLEPDFSQEV